MDTNDDEILSDLYRFRKEFAAAFDNDVGLMMEELIREQDKLEREGRKFAEYPPQRC